MSDRARQRGVARGRHRPSCRRAPRTPRPAPSRGPLAPALRPRRGRGARRSHGAAPDPSGRAGASPGRPGQRRAQPAPRRCGSAGRDDEVAWLFGLEHQPHRTNVVAGKAPVAAGGEVSDDHLGGVAERDGGGGSGDLTWDELQRAERGLVVVEDPARHEHPVALAVAPGDEVGVRLRDAVRGQRSKRRVLGLRRLGRLAEDLARGRLVHPNRRGR